MKRSTATVVSRVDRLPRRLEKRTVELWYTAPAYKVINGNEAMLYQSVRVYLPRCIYWQ